MDIQNRTKLHWKWSQSHSKCRGKCPNMPASLQLFNSVTWKPNSNACCRTPSSSNQQSIMGWMIPFSKRVSWRKVVLSNIVAIIITFFIIHILIFVYLKVKSFNIEITKYIYRQIYEIKEHLMIRWIKSLPWITRLNTGCLCFAVGGGARTGYSRPDTQNSLQWMLCIPPRIGAVTMSQWPRGILEIKIAAMLLWPTLWRTM